MASPNYNLNSLAANEYDRNPSNLVTVERNSVKDYKVEYDPIADAAGDANKTYRLVDNKGDFEYGDMVIYMTNSSGAAYVINVSNSTWFNPATSAVEVVPRLHYTHNTGAGNSRAGNINYDDGLYQRIWWEYVDNHGNKADTPTVKITPNGADKTAVDIDDAIKGLTKGVNGEYFIPYAMHKGQDVAFTVTPNTAIDKGAKASPDKGTLKFPGNDKEVGLAVTVTGSAMVGDGVAAKTETYYYVFRFEAPNGITVSLNAVDPVIASVDGTKTPKEFTVAAPCFSTIAGFIKAVEEGLTGFAASGETIRWAFYDSIGKIPRRRRDVEQQRARHIGTQHRGCDRCRKRGHRGLGI